MKPKPQSEEELEDRKETSGVQCPKCGCGHAPVYYTRQQLKRTIRKRICRHCGQRFTTTERVTGSHESSKPV